jgi:hypothetical protein
MHDLFVRDLEQARNRTPELRDLDDPTLVADGAVTVTEPGA